MRFVLAIGALTAIGMMTLTALAPKQAQAPETEDPPDTKTEVSLHSEKDANKLSDPRAERIDEYFRERGMPLEGYGQKLTEAADRHGLDWRLLPAIAVRESSGGKQACGNNPFGWASCRIHFESTEEAIETAAWNLGGGNPNTRAYYEGDTESKLWSYNGTVNPRYPGEVLRIMAQFDLK